MIWLPPAPAIIIPKAPDIVRPGDPRFFVGATVMQQMLLGTGAAAGGGGGAEATAFLARTSGLDATHTNAYIALIDGLVADGVWTKLDALYIWATQTSATALLNLVSSSYSATLQGSPTFTADRGFLGVAGSTTVYIDTNFNPSTAGSPKHVLNSAHVSYWSNTNAVSGASGTTAIGTNTASSTTNLEARYIDGNYYVKVNTTSHTGWAVPSTLGHFIANRSGASAQQGYRNGSSVGSDTIASVSVNNLNIYVLALNNNGSASNGSGRQSPMSSIGSSLSSTDATNFYNRLRTYMTTVGVP